MHLKHLAQILLCGTIVLLEAILFVGANMNVSKIIAEFDSFLGTEHQEFEAVIVGGAALNLLGIVTRVTNDVDVIHPESLPDAIAHAASQFAKTKNIPEGWLNCGPRSIVEYLPVGWESRSVVVFRGKNLRLVSLGRQELLFSKCWAYCDRERDLDDILAIQPTPVELDAVVAWLKPLDANPGWPAFVEKMIGRLAQMAGARHG